MAGLPRWTGVSGRAPGITEAGEVAGGRWGWREAGLRGHVLGLEGRRGRHSPLAYLLVVVTGSDGGLN
ncbi:hypothetical protein E2C01_074493 [Portunus trituberculatus]|uniref:Uncharacterized protein n=1 Tax=Portunus trituberculatus TaxID=210409 RepID=A0A5B7ICL8_PORTR|nr:hypothetical protein [Portunus trituberculatus]